MKKPGEGAKKQADCPAPDDVARPVDAKANAAVAHRCRNQSQEPGYRSREASPPGSSVSQRNRTTESQTQEQIHVESLGRMSAGKR